MCIFIACSSHRCRQKRRRQNDKLAATQSSSVNAGVSESVQLSTVANSPPQPNERVTNDGRNTTEAVVEAANPISTEYDTIPGDYVWPNTSGGYLILDGNSSRPTLPVSRNYEHLNERPSPSINNEYEELQSKV